MRLLVLVSIIAVAGLPAAAQAQLPAPPPLPVPTPTVPALPPLPLPPPTVPSAPAPVPTVPSAPTPVPTVPSTPAPVPSVPSTPTAPSAPSTPATGSGATSSGSGATSSGSGTATGSSGTAGEGSGPGTQRAGARKRPTVTLPFRVASTGRVRIPLTQIAPQCRSAGSLLFDARRGANRFRFNGRVGRRPLSDGTYVASTPSGDVRFAVVRGKPTRNPARLDASVCPPPEPLDDGLRSEVVGGGSSPSLGPPTASASGGGGGTDDGLPQLPLPQVLGTSLTEAAEAATSLHPAFYVLLALAIAALAAATLPARTMPAAAAGAALSRRRAELTLAGTVSLLTVIVAYWVTLL